MRRICAPGKIVVPMAYPPHIPYIRLYVNCQAEVLLLILNRLRIGELPKWIQGSIASLEWDHHAEQSVTISLESDSAQALESLFTRRHRRISVVYHVVVDGDVFHRSGGLKVRQPRASQLHLRGEHIDFLRFAYFGFWSLL